MRRLAFLIPAFVLSLPGDVSPSVTLPTVTPATTRLYDAVLSSPVDSLTVEIGEAGRIPLTLANRGTLPWVSAGDHPIYLSFHLLAGDGSIVRYENPRTSLARPVAPGGDLEELLLIDTFALPGPGSYVLQVDLVHEGETWFADRGSAPLEIPFEVRELSFERDVIPPAELARPTSSSLRLSVPALERLWRLIEITLRASLRDIEWEQRRYSGFAAGSGYPQFWVRDNATTVATSRWFFDSAPATGWIELHLSRQGDDGRVWDWVDPRGEVDKNTVETDQETSLVLGACRYAIQAGGRRWLSKHVSGTAILERLDRALVYVWERRRDAESGLLVGAHTIDWGDVDLVDADRSAVYTDERTAWTTDIYDQAMFILAARELASISRRIAAEPARAKRWEARADEIAAATRQRLWQEERGFFRVHRHLTSLAHDFDEPDMFAMGGNALAVLAGIAGPEESARIFETAIARQRRYETSTISASMLPPYPASTYRHPLVRDEYSYQNGGQWDWFGGRLILAMYRLGHSAMATRKLTEIAGQAVANRGIFEWQDREGTPRGSSWYSGAAGVLGRALVEGYFGVESELDVLRITPRLGSASGTLALHDASTGRFVSYDYEYDPPANRVRCRVFTDHPSPVRFAFLLPPRLQTEGRVFADGEAIPFEPRRIGEDVLAGFSLEIPAGGVTIEIR